MNIIDAIAILIILSCMAMGFKKGFTKELISFLGFFVIVIAAYLLKNQKYYMKIYHFLLLEAYLKVLLLLILYSMRLLPFLS